MTAKCSYISPKKAISDVIRSYYSRVPLSIRPRPPISITNMVGTLTAYGIGDCLMLSDLPEISHKQGHLVHVWAPCKDFYELFTFHPSYKVVENTGIMYPFMVDILRLRDIYDLGNGHLLQQLRRAWKLPVDLKPKPVLTTQAIKIKNRVILHFEPAKISAERQRKLIHPRMRELYSSSQEELEAFIKGCSKYEFIEVGKTSRCIEGAIFQPTETLSELVNLIATASWFIGIMSGPLHIAVATGAKVITVVNYPTADKIVLPTLRWTGTQEEEWYYPQNVHLHQEGESPLVPKITRESLLAAFDGDVYPFWRDDWLGLIENFI